jgi:GT2 family glycosyltransferase
MLSGAAVMVRREVLDTVGGFDERFEMYSEDNEWCFRISRAGWQLLFVPTAVVMHQGGHSASKRWTNLEKLRVKLEAEFLCEQLTLPRWRVIANRLASYFVASLQKLWRHIRGADVAELTLIKKLHWKHLLQIFKTDQVSHHTPSSKLGQTLTH